MLMSDPRDALSSKFKDTSRFANFGEVLMQMQVTGFRCHTNTVIRIASPITAFCGLNGTGKSTLLQLAAAAYKGGASRTGYYIKDFLIVSAFDPSPFNDDASIEYKYWQGERPQKTLTLSRSAATSSWRGYKRRPTRYVFFAGVGLYLPKVEQRDFICRKAGKLRLVRSNPVPREIKEWTSKILGLNYEDILSHDVMYSQQTGTVVSVRRGGNNYAEPNMGFGEGRTQYLVSMLETIPEKSLVLIEEPETSLHPSAQHEFGNYLVDVSRRKCHQIILTTHSEFLLESLPSNSRIYLYRDDINIKTIQGLTSLQAKSLMSQGHVKALHILVEDECAKIILQEILRRTDTDFLRSVGIYAVGGAPNIGVTMQTLRETGFPIAAVRDGDQGIEPRTNLFKLPGELPPEKELFQNLAVKQYLNETYHINLDDFIASIAGTDHHDWTRRFAYYINQNEIALLNEMARIYANQLAQSETASLTTLLKAAIE